MFGLFETGFSGLTLGPIVMLIIGCALLYLGIAKKMEPLLLVPIGFGVILTNLPFSGLMDTMVAGEVIDSYVIGAQPVGIMARIFYYGLTWEIVPVFIFLGLGALVDFGPLIANPKTLLLGAGAQFGVFFAFFVALMLGSAFPDILNIGIKEAASIGIIGGADGPTTIYLTNKLAPHFIGATAVAAYTYMALVPIIQPPIIRLLTSKKERQIYMKPQLRAVSKREKIFFPIAASFIIILLVPKSAPLIGMFMFGNLIKESGVTDRLAETAGNAFMNVLTILLGLAVGSFMSAETFLQAESMVVFVLGIIAFAASTAAGVLLAKLMNLFLKEKINPMIGAAGVSAVPMAARVVQRMGQQENPRNFLLMHAMGPNIAGVIGTATAAGIFLGMLG
ncbi:MAG: sodium ion-translocating decarboxylase subunit beta [Dehalococcoidales bacterium]